MIGAAGFLLALACFAIVSAGLALAVAAWRPRPGDGPAFALAVTAGLAVGALCFLLGALHWLAHLLT
ncbi:hypothetical protein [Streptomyces sp. NBC_00557]|uniref:hypothetical protein n=1 Tax=Streptomyces sp. NBC_00557 TaxID=2975776 RepID=UPI002E81FB17|nr:hypothetical protein [Streptomyces sp. NBC_00557]WUC36374.1 hypothetical protein OG956_20195 [Streptomyces sp. NBC_00557]